MQERQPCVYMLASQPSGTLYTGATSNLAARVVQHREGLIKGFTLRHRVKRLVWFEVAVTMEAAITREKRIKEWKRDWRVQLIEEPNPHWDDLAIPLFNLLPLTAPPPVRGSRLSPG